MNLQVSKWGNSLALRIPSNLARRLDLHVGDTVEARLTADGALGIRRGRWGRAEFTSEIGLVREATPMGTAVTDEFRGEARY